MSFFFSDSNPTTPGIQGDGHTKCELSLVFFALEYPVVVDDGIQSDWNQFIGSFEVNVSRAAVQSFARIMSRVSTADALRFVAEHESIDLGSGLVYERIVRRGEDPNLDGGIAGRYCKEV